MERHIAIVPIESGTSLNAILVTNLSTWSTHVVPLAFIEFCLNNHPAATIVDSVSVTIQVS
jgi:hypothetical protein